MAENGGSITRRFLCEVGAFFRQMGPVVAGITAIVAPIWFLADDVVNEWMAMPSRIASIEKRLGEPRTPFVEFRGSARMWPEQVIPGQTVLVSYLLRRNRNCETVVERRFQRVNDAVIDPQLITRGPAVETPLTLDFALSTEVLTIPGNILPGMYAYRPVLYCNGELPVIPPVIFFEVKAA